MILDGYFVATSALVLPFISLGILIKIKFPPKKKFFYYLRWGILFILYPILIGWPFISQSRIAFLNVTFLSALFFFMGMLIGFIDLKFKRDDEKNEIGHSSF